MSDDARVVTATIKFVGPITRSTLSETSDAKPEAVNDALHWLWATRTQIRRLNEGLRNELTTDAPTELHRRRTSSRTSLDEHLLLVCAGQLEKVVQSAQEHFPEIMLPPKLQTSLRHLRNVYEHWEQHRDAFRLPGVPKKRSGKAFSEQFPSGEPWAIEIYPGRDILVAKVVSVRSLSRELYRLERIILRVEAKAQSGMVGQGVQDSEAITA